MVDAGLGADAVIERLGLAPHPEGGWYRETWRAPPPPGGTRGAGTAILFLLEAGQRSHWHRVDATELWIFQGGEPLDLWTAAADPPGPVVPHVLGFDGSPNVEPQVVVEPGQWQSARARAGWSLVTCVVVPAFEFSGFELAPPGWEPGA